MPSYSARGLSQTTNSRILRTDRTTSNLHLKEFFLEVPGHLQAISFLWLLEPERSPVRAIDI